MIDSIKRFLTQTLGLEDRSKHVERIYTSVVPVLPRRLDAVVADGCKSHDVVHAWGKCFHAGENDLTHDLLTGAVGTRTGVPQVRKQNAGFESVRPSAAEHGGIASFE